MVAPMQFKFLSKIVKGNPHFNSLLDPFMGSGTTLVEGGSLGLKVTDMDINPYSITNNRVHIFQKSLILFSPYLIKIQLFLVHNKFY